MFGGRLSLDLTWTLVHRYLAPSELLTSDDDLRAWLVAAGVAPVDAPAEPGLLEEARSLRDAVYGTAHRRMRDEKFAARDLATINRWARTDSAAPQLTRTGAVVWVAEAPLSAGLAAVAVDAVEMLSGPRERLRECARESCAALFFDESRPGRRRWCSVERCGNAVNTARYRGKVQGTKR